jgi:hypothetical protein
MTASLRRTARLAAAGLFCATLFVSTAWAQAVRIDQGYTAKIKEYTTEPFFLTPWVDYLPASDTVPTPEKFLGHIAGAPDVLSYSSEIYGYLRAVAAASPRVEVFSIGRTEEGREMILAVVADEATIRDLQRYKDMNGRLADPRKTSEQEAQRLLDTAKPMYWATGALHSGETGSPEMLMELVYRLAVDESPAIKTIRDNIIFMTTPVVEPDGRDKQVDIHMARRKDPNAIAPTRLIYWGPYVAHDNNRDGLGLTLALSQNIMRTWLDFHPLVLHDLHESVAYLYTSTGTGPYNAWLDPIVIDEWYELAITEVSDMARLGVPGVWTYGYYDGWAPNYLFYVANGHNGIGKFYETQTAGDASTRVVSAAESRAWYRPNPPLDRVLWSMRNNTNIMMSTMLCALSHVAQNRRKFMENFWLKSKRSVAKARAEGPAAYILPASESRLGQQAALLNLLKRHGVEVHRADRAFKIGDREYGAGSYVVRMDQPYSRQADLMLDRQYFNVSDPRPYDDVGWTMGPLFGCETVRIEDAAVLEVAMKPVTGEVKPAGGTDRLSRRNPAAYLVNFTADNALATFVFQNPGLKIDAAEASFTAANVEFNAGSFILKTADNAADLEAQLKAAGEKYGFKAWAIDALPEVATHRITVPRVAVMHTWQSTQTEGWLRIALDSIQIPYEYISVHDVRDTPDLKSRWDAIVFGPSSGDALSIVNGMPMTGNPIPWKKTELTPNVGRQDESDDIRGGLDFTGIINLRKFLEAGGLFITLTSSSALPIHFGFASGISISDAPDLWARGGVFAASVADQTSPIAYGYPQQVGVYFSSGPVFSGGGGGGGFRGTGGRGGFGGAGGGSNRVSGRGGVGDPDIVQGRPRNMGAAAIEEWRRQQQEQQEPLSTFRGMGGMAAGRTRTIVRFEQDVSKLLISGGLDHGEQLAGTPAVVDAPMGEGHVVMFSINPTWRGETQGSYAFITNALIHHDHLDAGSVRTGR